MTGGSDGSPTAPPNPRRYVIDMFSSRHPMWCMPDADAERIRGVLPAGWEVIRIREEADGSGDGLPRGDPALGEALKGAEVYCGFGVPREIFAASDRLRWVHSGAAGVGGSLSPEMLEGDVVFTNSAGTHGVPLAEHAVAMMLYFARALDLIEGGRRRRRWERERIAGHDSPVHELGDATVGIVGYGGIGREVGRRARALGMKVWAIKRRPEVDPPAEVDRLLGPDRLHQLLAAADYVVLSVPHTRETEGLIGAAELAAMKRTAVLINLARGRLVDEDALIRALQAGAIRGAGLDVYREEPLPESSPLWDLENVCLTPHVGAVTPRFWERETELIIENTRRYLAGEPMLNVVNKMAGY